jgi:hypothetical protein
MSIPIRMRNPSLDGAFLTRNQRSCPDRRGIIGDAVDPRKVNPWEQRGSEKLPLPEPGASVPCPDLAATSRQAIGVD